MGAGAGDGPREGAGCGAVGSGSRAERYQVVVHTDAATLAEHGETGRSELDGVRVSAEISRRMACDTARVAMGHRDGEVVSVGRRRRTIPPHIRRALEERDRGCRYPGCRSRFTEAHHVRHWADGGETSLANTILLCRRHHRLIHEGRTRMAMDRDGKAAFFTRAGAVLGGSPPLPEVTRQLSEPPPPPPDRLSNGAPRFVDSAVPLSLELAALEAGGVIGRPRVAAAKPGTRACRNGTGHRRDSCFPARPASAGLADVVAELAGIGRRAEQRAAHAGGRALRPPGEGLGEG